MSELINLSSKQVVIYEDNPVWAKTMKLWCQNYGFGTVKTFDDEKILLHYVEENMFHIDLFLIDFYIGKDNTVETIKKIRSINNEFLIVAVSADFVNDDQVLDTEEMIKALSAGANRATIKEINGLKDIILSHMKIRSFEEFDSMKTDLKTIMDHINKNKTKES